MRCFIAIDLSEEIKEELAKTQEEIKKIGKEVKAKLRFVKPKILHFTSKFLGEVTDHQVNKVKESLKQIKFEPFKVKLNTLGVFPSENYIRVVWIDILPKEKLIELQQKIDTALNKEGFKKDKSFETHITLTRVKYIDNKEKEKFIKKLREIKVKPLEFEIKGFSLKKSILTKEGPIYEDIVRF